MHKQRKLARTRPGRSGRVREIFDTDSEFYTPPNKQRVDPVDEAHMTLARAVLQRAYFDILEGVNSDAHVFLTAQDGDYYQDRLFWLHMAAGQHGDPARMDLDLQYRLAQYLQ